MWQALLEEGAIYHGEYLRETFCVRVCVFMCGGYVCFLGFMSVFWNVMSVFGGLMSVFLVLFLLYFFFFFFSI